MEPHDASWWLMVVLGFSWLVTPLGFEVLAADRSRSSRHFLEPRGTVQDGEVFRGAAKQDPFWALPAMSFRCRHKQHVKGHGLMIIASTTRMA